MLSKALELILDWLEGEDPDWIVFILMRYLRYMVTFGKKILYVFIARGKQKCYLNNMILVKYQ